MATWTRVTGAPRSVTAVLEVPTETAPTADDGIELNDVRAVAVFLRAPEGETFDGTGAMRGYVKSAIDDTWGRAPRMDIDMAEFANEEVISLPPLPVSAPISRAALIPEDVGVSSGTEMTAELIAILNNGRQG
jgi:hypothetical protein